MSEASNSCTVPGCHEGWLHYSTGAPMDVCDACYGTGFADAYTAYNAMTDMRNLAEKARCICDGGGSILHTRGPNCTGGTA